MKHLVLSVLFLSFCLTELSGASDSPIVVSGIVHDENGKPMAAAIVEQYMTHNYVITDMEGNFTLKLHPSPESTKIEVRFVEYKVETIDVRRLGNSALLITLEPEDPKPIYNKPKLPTMNAFNMKVGYDYTGAAFNGYSELHPAQVNLLNSLNHGIVLGLSGYYKNFLIDFSWGIHPKMTRRTELHRGIAQAHHLGLRFGYAFPIYTNRLYITPVLTINRYQYNQYVAPLDNNISLDDYLQQGYLDISFEQWTGIIGSEFNWKIAEIGRLKKQALMANLGVGYHFKLHQYAHIYAIRTEITSPHQIGLNGLYLEASLRYIFTYKSVREIKNELIEQRLNGLSR